MSKFVAIFISLYFFNTNLAGQEVTLGGVGFLPYETYYISSIDLSTGGSSVQLFEFLITEETYALLHLRIIYPKRLEIRN